MQCKHQTWSLLSWILDIDLKSVLNLHFSINLSVDLKGFKRSDNDIVVVGTCNTMSCKFLTTFEKDKYKSKLLVATWRKAQI